MNVLRAGIVLAVMVALGVTRTAGEQSAPPVDDAALKNAGKDGRNWPSYGLTASETRFSPLTQLTASNVKNLRLAWSYDLGPGGGAQGTPLAWNGTLYGITNWSVVFAVDAQTGKERWRWNPEVNQAAVLPHVCCGIVSRGVALYQGRVIAPIIDGRLQAIDAETGKPVWEARVGYPQEHLTITMAPRVADGKVIVGASGGDYPVRGFFDAYDALTGRRLWRVYTVPGNPSLGFENAAMRRAAATWEQEWWKLGGGGAVWDGLAYDPDARLIYVGTGNAYPYPESFRSPSGKDNLYAASILAVDADTGVLKWHYQAVPGDAWDFDAVQQLILAELTINDRRRRVVMQANKNGVFYVLDRLTGEFISAEPYARLNWANGFDSKTGRPAINPEARYGVEPIAIRPGGIGAHGTSTMSFNPVTGLVYVSTFDVFHGVYRVPPEFNPRIGPPGWTPGRTTTRPEPPSIGPSPEESAPMSLIAWDPVARRPRWRAVGGSGIGGGTLTTASNLVFQTFGDVLVVYSADKGEKLLEVKTGVAGGDGDPRMLGAPITFEAGGRQYVALMAGMGLVAGRPAPAPSQPSPIPPKLLAYTLTND